MQECIVKCAFLSEEKTQDGYKNIRINFETEGPLNLKIKHKYKKNASSEACLMKLKGGIEEKVFTVCEDIEFLNLIIIDESTQKSQKIIIPLSADGQVFYDKINKQKFQEEII